ncbi:SDR family oxidoreductase [Rhodococcus sp. NPDC058514]|uniref:SDR family oxidoreductase n=1 Tax=unclassified Rhodococcus (in: high G+C Gram-positive bacteria) TaxID=192944 RepID=UPI00364A56C0
MTSAAKTRTRILITGASSGLGAEMARQFAAKGRDLALCARRVDRLEELRAELLAAHPSIRVAVRTLDVNDHRAVSRVFGELDDELGGLDRIVVNAGLGKGAAIGTGRPEANLETAQTNFVGALAQVEAAMELFRARGAGHLVLVSSMSAVRGLPRAQTAYSASKAAVSAIGEGLSAELSRSPITVTTILPGYIRTAINETVAKTPLMADTVAGVRSMVKAIEREPRRAVVPGWPWRPIDLALRVLPTRLTGHFL